MPVFRVERNKGYTVMSNYHLRDKSLSLKAKGLLSQILSLPEDWDYTLSGLCYINRESKDAIRSAVNELERAGYIERHQTTDEGGKFSSNEYIIHEQSVSLPPSLDKPSSENPTTGKPTSENPTQLNKDRETKDQSITDPSITHSIPSLSPPPAVAASPPERKRTEAATQSAVEIYRELIKENIEYDHLLRHSKIDREELDGIVELLVETVCTARKTIRVAGDDYPAELVKAKLLKLNSGHIEFVMDCMRENTTKIRNIKKYLLAVLFNAPSTMGSYYTALVAHDMAEGKI
ncbi:hypothetical protein C814_03362 [Anaerotruncus sp. G3(2012)]|uniref:DUF6017 domain-containing protein n=1 Tax=Anaerotruncus sp. G3(2012) TaxID=1235835 RepID=UPI00033D2007|nr:DUF6017 domain-containing protein [Anaerotruncus sp. G3(2012)]EOS54869.1 hypothetical protein C814_03362 [Anaerotruncus sp. G3(2012)]